jgi:hypothetical protein
MLRPLRPALLVCTAAVISALFATGRGTPDQELVDTLTYFVSHHPDIALEGDAWDASRPVTAAHPLSLTVDGSRSYYVKWHPSAYELFRWDDEDIYLSEDHTWATVDGRLEPYAMRPGVWMKRHMRVGEVVDMGANLRRLLQARDCGPARWTSLGYKMVLEKHDPHFDVGGELGIQDVIVLRYDYSRWTGLPERRGVNAFERFYYSREWGWIQWDYYEDADLHRRWPRLHSRMRYNRRAAHKLSPDPDAGCNRARFGGMTLDGRPMPAAPSIAEDETHTATLTFLNVGTTTWRDDGDIQFEVGAVGDDPAWGARVALPHPVPPGGTVTVSLTIRPPAAGVFPFQWRMVLEGAEWFGEPSPPVEIQVRPRGQGSGDTE